MSGGDKFNKKIEISDSERLQELERKIPIFLERMQAYDQVLTDFKELKIKFNEQSNLLNSLCSDFSQHVLEFQEYKKYSMISHSNSLEGVKVSQSLSETISVVNSRVKSCNKNIQDTQNQLDDHKKTISQKIDEKPSHYDLSNKADVESIELLKKCIIEWKKDIYKRLESSKLNDEQLDLIGKLPQEIKRLDHNHDCSFEFINTVKEELDEKDKQYSISLQNHYRNITQDFTNQLDKFKDDILSIPNPTNTIKEELSHRLDVACLDASNANLKSSNSVQQITILEKKLENVLLLIKKHELNQ